MSYCVSVTNVSQLNNDNGIRNLYCEKFGTEPEWVITCPGRVNLIGEHIDYSGYSVLPMAIRVNTCLAVGKSDDKLLHFENVDPTKYRSAECEVASSIVSSELNDKVQWHHYFIAGWRGALETLLGLKERPFEEKLVEGVKGINVACAGTIPPSAGLSSSSALVCAATLATLAIHTSKEEVERIDRCNLAEIATSAERFVGTEGGGMDQACECIAQTDFALRIDFHPLKFELVKLPPNALFAVIHSGTEMNKAATSYYNERVVECRLAAQVLCKKAALLNANSEEIMQRVRTLKDAAHNFGLDAQDPSEMLQYVDKYLKPIDEAYSRNEIMEILEITDDQLVKSLNKSTLNMQTFWLTKRAVHVYSESSRVLAFERSCRRSASDDQTTENNNDTLNELAHLMNESHRSCRDNYECSCKELDDVVDKCKAAGFLGARLTGAGWGGCVVALLHESHYRQVNTEELNILFWSEPSNGIKAFTVSN